MHFNGNYLFIDLFTMAYIYFAVLYIFTTLLSSSMLHFSKLKNCTSKYVFLYSLSVMLGTAQPQFIKLKYIFCLNLTTDFDPRLDEVIN